MAKNGVQRLRSLSLHRRRDVAVEVEGRADASVAQHLGYDLGVYALTQQERSGGVAQVMEANARQPSPLQQRKERPTQKVPCLDGSSDLVREKKVVVLPSRAQGEALLSLGYAMPAQSVDGSLC